jgi:holo-[acyl-carrier protein] synthase
LNALYIFTLQPSHQHLVQRPWQQSFIFPYIPVSHFKREVHMIVGHGIDITDTRRIAQLIEKYAHHFLDKVFTPQEQLYCAKMAAAPLHYAGRWAAKEAFYKALPPLLQPLATWHSIQILPQANSPKPCVELLADRLRQGITNSGIDNIHLSISHEQHFCIASIILER